MKLVYTHENHLIVGNMVNLIENEGISVTLKNQFSGGAAGDIAPHETWPEIWVAQDDFDTALKIIEVALLSSNKPDWHCDECGESNPASFEICWHCESPHSNKA